MVWCLGSIQLISCFVVLVSLRIIQQDGDGFIYLRQDLNMFQLGKVLYGQLMQQITFSTMMVSDTTYLLINYN